MRRYRYGKRRGRVPVIAIAFGIGLCVALCCSVKLTLFIAAILLIYMGLTCR